MKFVKTLIKTMFKIAIFPFLVIAGVMMILADSLMYTYFWSCNDNTGLEIHKSNIEQTMSIIVDFIKK